MLVSNFVYYFILVPCFLLSSLVIVISKVGEEPSIFSDHFEDQLQQLGADFVNMPTKKRKAYFTKYSNLLQHSYDPQYVYTFDFYQHLFNFATFQVSHLIPMVFLISTLTCLSLCCRLN